jgi:hypothetical protein
VGIPPRLRDFQAEGESPAGGLFHAAAFSTALLPTNSATEPYFTATALGKSSNPEVMNMAAHISHAWILGSNCQCADWCTSWD